MQGFQEAYREFFDSWAETKNEVPAEDLEYVRRLRHVCRRTAHGVSATLAQLAAPGSESGSAALPRTLQRRLDELLAQLDRLFTAMADIKIREIQRLLLKE
jgi:hypothetical protein